MNFKEDILMKEEHLPITLRVEEVAKIMRISKAVAYELSKRDDFPSIKVGRRIIISRDSFFQWFNDINGVEGQK